MRHWVVAMTWFMTLCGSACAAQQTPPARPNILFILSDDQNPDTLGCFGGKVLTPTLDKLCAEGVKFTRAYNSSSVCTPSRYTCMTGQYASRCGTPQFLKSFPPGRQSNVGFNVQVAPGSWNVARVLRQHGYWTGFVGKWHTGTPPLLSIPADARLRDPEVGKKLAENQRRLCDYIKEAGFDYAASVYRGNLADHKLDALQYHNMEWVTKGALDFIEQAGDKPFFLHLCTTLQHSPAPNQSLRGDPTMTPAGYLPAPLEVQASRAGIAERLKKAGIAENMGHATWLDDGIAAVVKKLVDLGKLDNTVILFFSDNTTLGGKGTCYDGGARTPCFLWGKGRIPAGQVCDRLVQNIDFVPTIFDLAGARPPAEMKLDGMSLMPLVTGAQTKWRAALFLEIGHTRAICTERWKYIALRYPPQIRQQIADGTLGRPAYHMDVSLNLQEAALKRHPAYWDADQLYDLQADPQERVNLIKDPQQAQTVADVQGRLKDWLAGFNRPFGEFVP
ncbi:MAG: sulfatase-like hydrolase/transferase [Planctomycetes bacterium]|nr:sulfatase-like hydrolase/transferase [Planctomycetota bacterium]